MAFAQEKSSSFADYLAWDKDEPVELIKGQLVMHAQPSPYHEEIIVELVRQIANFLEGKKCKVYSSRLDVKLFANPQDSETSIETCVVPDISIVCDSSKIDNKGCNGAPDMVAEVLSPSSRRDDRITKYNLYQEAGVKEYWIVSPDENTVQVFVLQNGIYTPRELYTQSDTAKVNVLDGCFVKLSKVFKQ